MSRRRTALVAALAALAGCNLESNPLVVRWFGPPRPDMVERYAGDPSRATFDHSALDAVLAAHVRGYRFDYQGLAADPAPLDAYIGQLATAPFGDLDRDGKLALLINAYNAFTLRLILDHLPLSSIKDIPRAERWDAERWDLGGERVSLTSLEHDWLRARFVEPRIHFAINCASVGCPPLRAEAYVPDRLEAQLADQAHTIHHDPAWVRLDGDTVYLTPLYLWYASDFAHGGGTPLGYAARHRPELATGMWKVAYLDYDWSLNQ